MNGHETENVVDPAGITPPEEQQPAAPEQEQSNQVVVDDSRAMSGYSNFCRLTSTPEELLIDFGLNAQQFDVPVQNVRITQRIVMNMFTAKRLAQVLYMTVQRHEAFFGMLETDVQKRAIRE